MAKIKLKRHAVLVNNINPTTNINFLPDLKLIQAISKRGKENIEF